MRTDRQARRQHHRAHADRVDVPQVRPLELDARRRKAQRLVDDQVGHHGHHPGDGNVGVEAEHIAERLEHVHLHQHEGDERVEHHPHHTPRMAVRDAREKIAPRQRTGVGVGDVDLELRDHHEQRRGRDRPAVVREHILVGCQVHLVRVDGTLGRHHVRDGQVRQQRATEHLDDAQDDPARSACQHADPPAATARGRACRHESQVVGLLAHLRDERNADGQRGTKKRQTETSMVALQPNVVRHTGESTRIARQYETERHHQHQQPDRLRPQLQAADGGNAVRYQRNDDQRAEEVTPHRRHAQRQLQRIGHHGGFQRKKDEGEGRVDQRRDGRADVAEARAARQQVHVDAMARGVDADRQAGQEDDQPGQQDGPEGVDETVLHQQRGAHRFEDQEGCSPESRVGHTPFGPLAKALRGVAQCVVFQRFARDPAVVVAPDLDDALRCVGQVEGIDCTGSARQGWRGGYGFGHTFSVQLSCHAQTKFLRRHDCCNSCELPIMPGPQPTAT